MQPERSNDPYQQPYQSPPSSIEPPTEPTEPATAPQSQWQPPQEVPKKPKRRFAFILAAIVIVLVAVAAAAVAYFTVKASSDASFKQAVESVNEMVAGRMPAEQKLNASLAEATSTEANMGLLSDPDAANEMRAQVEIAVDDYLKDCANFKQTFYDADQLPRATDMPLLSPQKKSLLNKMKVELAAYEKSTCIETKAQAGYTFFMLDMIGAYYDILSNASYLTGSGTGSEAVNEPSLSGLAPFADSYTITYEKEIRDAYGDEVAVAIRTMSDYLKDMHTFFKQASEDMENIDPNKLDEINKAFTDSEATDTLDSAIKKQYEESFKRSHNMYVTMKSASNAADAANYSEPVYVGSVVYNALNRYKNENDHLPRSDSTSDAMTEMKSAKIIAPNAQYPTDNITYENTGINEGSLKVVDPINNKTYEFSI